MSFSIKNHKYLSYIFPIHLNTCYGSTVIINICTLSVRWIDFESQNLTSKTTPALQGLTTSSWMVSVFHSFKVGIANAISSFYNEKKICLFMRNTHLAHCIIYIFIVHLSVLTYFVPLYMRVYIYGFSSPMVNTRHTIATQHYIHTQGLDPEPIGCLESALIW